jgi:hypothetical protein
MSLESIKSSQMVAGQEESKINRRGLPPLSLWTGLVSTALQLAK